MEMTVGDIVDNKKCSKLEIKLTFSFQVTLNGTENVIVRGQIKKLVQNVPIFENYTALEHVVVPWHGHLGATNSSDVTTDQLYVFDHDLFDLSYPSLLRV